MRPLILTLSITPILTLFLTTIHALSPSVHAATAPAIASATATATLTGRVVDQSGGVVAHVEVVVVDPATGLERKTETSERGEFVLPGLPPARYQLTAQHDGFAPLQVPDLVLHVNDEAVLLLTLEVSPIGEAVVVEASAVRVRPSPGVSTVVERQLVEHLPLNARSLQSLIWLVPGMVRTSGSGYGQFSANGQRDNANYVTIDGASANVSAGHTLPAAGGVLAVSRLGTTNNLIAIDAMEDVRVQTSSYAAEFGRTPGAQIAIRSRSGTNQLHGAAFEYFRDEALDANDWFANSANQEKAELRHHQFGGVLGGPVVKNRAFFFGSYEGLRLRQPTTIVALVPSTRAREIAAPDVQRLLRAFPEPTTSHVTRPGLQGEYIGSISMPARLDAASGRLDYQASPRLMVFGRYNQAPSDITMAESWNAAAHKRHTDRTRTITGGLQAALSPRLYNELRVNFSSNARAESARVVARDGAAELTRSEVLSTPQAQFWGMFFDSTSIVHLSDERGALARQINIVDSLTAIAGSHQIKLGVDIRHLALRLYGQEYLQAVHFDTEADIVRGIAPVAFIEAEVPRAPLMRNYSAYVQDTWHVTPEVTLTFGLRWDANPAPFDEDDRRPFVLRGREGEDPSGARVTLLPEGESLYRTRWWNFAPRVGGSYRLPERRPGWGAVLRGGAGVFYDLGNAATLYAFDRNPPFVSSVLRSGVGFPLSPADAAPAPQMPASGVPSTIIAVDPNLRLPYTWQWNAAIAQSLGRHQTLTVTYVGAAGRRLLQRQYFASLPGVPSITSGSLVTSDSRSAYRALQMQFDRRMSRGLQVLTSYSWAHARDAQSDDLNVFDDQELWGDADFDVRHSAAAGVTWDLPWPGAGAQSAHPALIRLFGDWGVDAMVRASSAYPFTPRGGVNIMSDGTLASTLPDVVAGEPIWIFDPSAAGGRRLNPAAFTMPAAGQQGNVGRNRLRGFPFSQLDVALRRTFRPRDDLRLSFRVEAFNVLNRPNFMNPSAADRLGTLNFGRSTQMANRGFGGVQGPGLQQFYESGGPRSMQLSLRVEF